MFKTECIYIGKDMAEFNRIRDILDLNKIKYGYKVRNQVGKWLGVFGGGTLRSRTANIAVPTEEMYEYEIKIARDDVERAQYLRRK